MIRKRFLLLCVIILLLGGGIYFLKSSQLFEGYFRNNFFKSENLCKKYQKFCRKKQKNRDQVYALLKNPRILRAIHLNPLITENNYQNILKRKIDELVSDNTSTWSDYRNNNSWTPDELLEIYLQKVAFILYVEVYRHVPWSILDYSDDHLNLLLSDLFVPNRFYISSRQPVFNGNPLMTFRYANELKNLYPDRPIRTQKDLLDLLIIRMRDDGWLHARGDETAVETCHFPIWDFQCLKETRRGSSIFTAHFIYAVLQSYNIPSQEEVAYLPGGHTGIRLPTIQLIFEGNAIYNAFKAGLILRPNYLPVNLTYIDLSVYENWNRLSSCEAHERSGRAQVLNYLNLYDNLLWNPDLIAAYCVHPPGYEEPGNYLKEIIDNGTTIADCQSDNPSAPNYQARPLNDTEWTVWLDRLASITECR